VNITPAIAPDGTIYSVTVAHNPFASRFAYVVAFNPNLTVKWTASMRNRIHDGCGVLLTIGLPGGCRAGTPANGVDPATNEAPAGRVIDQSSSSPVVTPDGGVIYGSYTRYNYARGHMFRFDRNGNFAAAYDFGWDSTPAIYPHFGSYSIVIKDNHYDAPLYCFKDDPICQTLPPGPFYITQLDASLNIEWQFQNTTIDSDHPNGYEWCINAPAIDSAGTVYVNSEDGNVYAGSR
jgi:outer membrane protein assembly factor BamB